ncbi:MAG: hypothetical protein RLY93_04075 [Sumerlaeia bacterium]
MGIFGKDDRLIIAGTEAWPHRTVGSATRWGGTFSLLTPETAISCAHLGTRRGWMAFGPREAWPRDPFGYALALERMVHPRYINGGETPEFDVGVYRLAHVHRDIGPPVAFEPGRHPPSGFRGAIAGYPSDAAALAGTPVQMHVTGGVEADGADYHTRMDLAFGSSGSPLWRIDGADSHRLVGIAQAIGRNNNFAVRLHRGDMLPWLEDQIRWRRKPPDPVRTFEELAHPRNRNPDHWSGEVIYGPARATLTRLPDTTMGLRVHQVRPGAPSFAFWESKAPLDPLPRGLHRIVARVHAEHPAGREPPTVRLRAFPADHRRHAAAGTLLRAAAGDRETIEIELAWASDGATPWKIAFDVIATEAPTGSAALIGLALNP